MEHIAVIVCGVILLVLGTSGTIFSFIHYSIPGAVLAVFVTAIVGAISIYLLTGPVVG